MGRLTLQDMHARAALRGGLCLSIVFVEAHSNLTWQCSEGHTWEARPSMVPRQWCPFCSGNAPLTLEDMQARAAAHGGKCLSTTYVNTATKLRWQCAEGHVWEAVPNTIQKHWCPHCSGKARLTIGLMQEMAASHGGKCLSETYINGETKLQWQCAKGHTWEAVPNNVRNNKRWCPYCRDLVGEASCRAWLEQRFGKPFPKANPEWLRRSSGTRLQLDGYNEELRLAFEYQGPQHYRPALWFGKSTADFEAQQQRDAEKVVKCAAHGVRLLVVPYHACPVEAFMERQLGLVLDGVSQDGGTHGHHQHRPSTRM